MGLTFPRPLARGFGGVADISLLQGRLRGAGELIGDRQDLRAPRRRSSSRGVICFLAT
jgi:hypothetical protein